MMAYDVGGMTYNTQGTNVYSSPVTSNVTMIVVQFPDFLFVDRTVINRNLIHSRHGIEDVTRDYEAKAGLYSAPDVSRQSIPFPTRRRTARAVRNWRRA